jgi:hypothetical protein
MSYKYPPGGRGVSRECILLIRPLNMPEACLIRWILLEIERWDECARHVAPRYKRSTYSVVRRRAVASGRRPSPARILSHQVFWFAGSRNDAGHRWMGEDIFQEELRPGFAVELSRLGGKRFPRTLRNGAPASNGRFTRTAVPMSVARGNKRLKTEPTSCVTNCPASIDILTAWRTSPARR